jgi:Domain of unknown function (DUF4055)
MSTGVQDTSLAVDLMRPDWALVAALLGGTRTMREAGQTYLPKWPKEETEAYTTRLSVSVLFPAYQRTVQTLAGKPFSKPITIGEDVPARFGPWLADIDLQGRNLDTFASDVMQTALGYGLSGILIDYPPALGVRTQAQEQAAGLRPYWIEVKPQQILGWRAARIDGYWKLLQLRIAEVVEEPDGEFGTTMVEQVRVLEIGSWRTYRSSDAGAWGLFEEGITTLDMIPFVPVYGGRTGFMTAVPPLIEVAHLNVAHWQSASDQQNILHVSRVPILTVTGVQDETWTMTVGSSSAIKLPADSKMAFVEHTGAAIGAGADDLKTLEERMRQAGAELLVIDPGRITATQIMTENAVGMSVLQRITLGFEDALDQALQITADWVGEATGGHVTVFNDYGAASLQEASAQLLLSTNQAGKLSDETLHSEYQRRGILSADVSWEDEQARIEQQGPALGEMATPAPTDPLAAPVAQPGAPVAPSFDVDALITAIGSISFPAPIVNVAAQPAPQITVEAPTINVTVPEQAPPVVNIAPAAITVNMPEQPGPVVNVAAPIVNVEPAQVTLPSITVNSPPVNIAVEKGSGTVKFTEDSDGNITWAVMQ